MSDEHAIVSVNDLSGMLPTKYDDSDFSDVSKSGGDFLPRLQLMTGTSEKCKAGEFPVNNYALVEGQNFTDLGKNVDVAILSWRPKALEIGEVIISRYDPKDSEFQRIMEKSNTPKSGCMFGPEFLIYVGSVGRFATFFCSSKSARREAPNIKNLMVGLGTLGSQKIEKGKYTWYSPQVRACSTPLAEMPTVVELQEQVEKFNNPQESEVERVDDSGEDTGRAR